VTVWEFAGVTAVMFIGSFVQGSVGFGLNLIGAPFLALVDPSFVPGPAIGGAMALTLLVGWRDRSDMDRGAVGQALIGRLPGSIAAVVVMHTLSTDGLPIFFAATVLLAVAILISGVHVRPTRPNLIGAGVLSGFMGTTTSIGGPPLAMLYANEHGRTARATLSGFFVTGGVISLVILAVDGRFGWGDVGISLALVPGIVLGFVASRWGARSLDGGYTRPAILGLSALSAVIVLLKAL
jgi:uncharacterized membrane protein YfcA